MVDEGRRPIWIGLALLLLVGAPAVAQTAGAQPPAAAAPDAGELTFNHVLDKSRIEFTYKPEQRITEAVENFHKTAKNAYDGNADATAKGKELYEQYCAACHLKDGSGRIGPNLTDDEWRYPQVATDKGLFEIVYAGGAGAMQAFGRRITQDQILQIMAYVRSFRPN